MPDLIVGTIPERLTFFFRKKETIQPRWDKLDTLLDEPLDVFPAYISDEGNKGRMETGQRWAAGGRWSNQGTAEKIVEGVPNIPFKVRIVDVEHRAEGGLAFKVVFGKNGDAPIYVDLRDDVLLETLMHAGCAKDGTLGGEFIWGIVGSHMKLVRVGSALHEALALSTQKKKQGKLKASTIEVGGIYQMRGGKQLVYLGPVDVNLLVAYNPNTDERIDPRQSWRLHGAPIVLKLERKVGHGWYEVADRPSRKNWNYYGFEFKASQPAVTEKVGTMKVPPDVFEQIRATARAAHNERHIPMFNKPAPVDVPVRPINQDDAAYYSQYLNLGRKGENFIHPDLAKFMPGQVK